MKITVFTDCKDTNVLARQSARYHALLPDAAVDIYGISHDIEAAGCIVDVLDAGLGTEQIIIANVAPRSDKKYANGCPFSYTRVGRAVIIGTPTVFFLLKRLGLVSNIFLTDVRSVCSQFLDEAMVNAIANSQFRSFEYLPRLALWISEGKKIPSENFAIEDNGLVTVWFIDNFGNCKTTATDISELSDEYQRLPFFDRLCDVPVGTAAITRGSSGLGSVRFLEIVVQGKSAADRLGLCVGETVASLN